MWTNHAVPKALIIILFGIIYQIDFNSVRRWNGKENKKKNYRNQYECKKLPDQMRLFEYLKR